ncbi:MAG: tRNA lysidine(34) synthetase TilS [Treponema sp.]|nr:tRNA lysidine(34) synthetase TilS [Treponema sp.]
MLPVSLPQPLFEARLSSALGELPAGSVCLAAVSGGADSTAMLAGLARLREKAGFVLRCVHVEHGIRQSGESRGDAQAVRALCEALNVPCRVVSIAPGRIAAFARNGGPGIEGAARVFRQRALRREARRTGAGYILTAHTRDDLLETILMRVLRGSGPAGLAPMPRARGPMLRPLLDITRRDVLSYLEERGIPYRTDSTNACLRFLRNRVRRELVPVLDEFFPFWRGSLLALAETQAMTAGFLAREAQKRLPWLEEAGETEGQALLRQPQADFFAAPPILREEAVFAGVDILAALRNSAYVPVPRRSTVRRAVSVGPLSGGRDSPPQDLGPARLRRQGGFVELVSGARPSGERGFSLLVNRAGVFTLAGSVVGLKKNPPLYIRAGSASGGDAAGVFSAALPLVLRNHRAGDRIVKGGHKRRFSDILDRKARLEYAGIITAEDARGPAAFICIKRGGEVLVISREIAACGAASLFEVGAHAE